VTPSTSPLTPDSFPLTPHIAVIGAGYWGKKPRPQLPSTRRPENHLRSIQHYPPADGQDYPDAQVTDDFNAVLSDPAIKAVVISAPAASTMHWQHRSSMPANTALSKSLCR